MKQTKHKTYGRVLVSQEAMEDDSPMVPVRIINARAGKPWTQDLVVGKCDLRLKSKFKERHKAKGLVEKFIPFARSKAWEAHAKFSNNLQDNLMADYTEYESYAMECLILLADSYVMEGHKFAFSTYLNEKLWRMLWDRLAPMKHKKKFSLYDASVDPSDVVDFTPGTEDQHRDLLVREVLTAFDSLTDIQREVMKLYFIEGQTTLSIGEELGLANSTVKTYKRRAIRKVQKIIGVSVT